MNKSSFNSQKMESPAPITDCTAHAASHTRPDFGLGKDPSSRLSELQMLLKQPYARYRQLPDTIHGVNRLFSIEASLNQFCAVGTAQTKKEAKRRASTALLQKMGYEVPEKDLLDVTPAPGDRSLQNLPQNTAPSASRKDETSCVHIGPDFGLGKDPSSRLSELQMLRREKYAVYRTLEEKMVKNNCLFTIQASLNQFTGTGTAFTKKEAKRKASTALLLNMGFIVPEEDLPVENGLQKQVSPPGQAVVMDEAAERSSREEQRLGETPPSQERAGDLHGPDMNLQDLQAAPGDPETQADDDQSQQHGSEPQREQQTPEDTEECSSENSRDIETAPEDITDSGDIHGPSDDATGDCPTGPETQSLEDNTKSDDFVLFSNPREDVDNSSDGHQSLDETTEKPTEIEAPEGPGDDTDEAFTADEPHVDPLSSEAPTDSTNDSVTAVVQNQDDGTNFERAESLGETLIPQDVEIREETELPEDPLDSLEEVTETTEPGEILPDQSVENISVTSEEIHNPCPKDITDGHQILEEMLEMALKSPLWAQTIEEEDEDLIDPEIYQIWGSLGEVPEGESVEEIRATSADSSSEGRQSPLETLSPEEREILDDDTNSESAGSLVETLIPQDVEIREETELPEDPTEPEGVEEVTETTEAGEILPDRSVENISVTSEEIHDPCPKDIISDGHQILEEMLEMALKSPLWAQTIEEENEDLIDPEIYQIWGSLGEVPEGESVEEIRATSADSSSEGRQSPSETLSPEEREILDDNTNSENAGSLVEILIPQDVEIREETELPEDPTEPEGVEEVKEMTEAGEILPDRSVENISVTSEEIHNPCPKDITDGHHILEEMLEMALKSPLWAQTIEEEDEDLIDPEIYQIWGSLGEVPEGESVEEIRATSADSSSEGRQSPSETLSPEEREFLDNDTNSESAGSLVETLIPQDVEIREETELPEDPTEPEGVEEVTETTEAGEILPDRSVENISVTSEEIHDPCPKDIISDGHQILEEMLEMALKSPLWAQTIEEEDEDLIDPEIPEASHTDASEENSSDIYNDSFQSPEEPQCPDQSLDQSPDPEPANPVETEELLTVPESTEAPDTVPDRTAESFVIWVMVKKLLKHEPAYLRSFRDTLVDLLEKAALDHFVIPEGVHLKARNVQKLGKAAARDLMHEYGGSFKVLLAVMGTKTTEFQEDAMKHLNIRLKAFENRPKSGLKRLFSKWDKPYH